LPDTLDAAGFDHVQRTGRSQVHLPRRRHGLRSIARRVESLIRLDACNGIEDVIADGEIDALLLRNIPEEFLEFRRRALRPRASNDDLFAAGHQLAREVHPYEARSAHDKSFHAVPFDAW